MLAPSRLLATDLDNTLVGDPAALAAFNRWFAARRNRWRLAYLTGRSLGSTWELITAQGLLLPDALATDVGTVFHVSRRHPPCSLSDYDLDDQWRAQLSGGWDGDRIFGLLAGTPGLTVQPGGRRPLRIGLWVDSPAAAAAARQALASREPGVRVVYSSGRDLDVLPRGAGKGPALRWLVRRWQLADQDVLACGDSGNDLDMLTAGFPAVMVANAQPELRQAELPPLVQRAARPHAWGILDWLQANGD